MARLAAELATEVFIVSNTIINWADFAVYSSTDQMVCYDQGVFFPVGPRALPAGNP